MTFSTCNYKKNNNKNKKNNRLHEACLRISYGDKQSWFEESLEKDGCFYSWEKQILATEMYKVSKGMSPPHITEYSNKKMNILII